MTATNKPMTGAQLDELMAVAMRMQSDSEKMGERPVSIFAYAVQIAVLEIREVRRKYEELQSQNADLAVQLANAESKCRGLAAENAGMKADQVRIFNSGYQSGHESTVEGYYVDIHQNDMTTYHEDIVAEIAEEQTPSTAAFLDEVRAQESAPLVRALTVIANSEQHDGETVVCDFDTLISVAAGALRDHYAAKLHTGAAL